MQIERAKVDSESLEQYRALFAICFPSATVYSAEYLLWQYQHNPDGDVVGFNAIVDGQVIAHYACLPCQIILNGRHVKALLSLNTATHPGFQGKGLFVKLAQQTFDAAAQEGFGAVYGIANANSTPGFIRKLGFTLVRPLDAVFGFGRGPSLILPGEHSQIGFARQWSDAALAWRLANPSNPVRVAHTRTGGLLFAAPAGKPLVSAWSERAARGSGNDEVRAHGLGLSPCRVFLGCGASGLKNGLFFSIPDRLKPSPLNFIFRDLVSDHNRLSAERVYCDFLDFDAF